MHAGTARFVYWLPSLFLLGFLSSLILAYFGIYLLLVPFVLYILAVLIDASWKNRSLWVGFAGCLAVFCQFFGYGSGFLRAIFRIHFERKTDREAFPGMFA